MVLDQRLHRYARSHPEEFNAGWRSLVILDLDGAKIAALALGDVDKAPLEIPAKIENGLELGPGQPTGGVILFGKAVSLMFSVWREPKVTMASSRRSSLR